MRMRMLRMMISQFNGTSTPKRSRMRMLRMMISQFNGTSTPKGSYRAKTGVNCPMRLNRVH